MMTTNVFSYSRLSKFQQCPKSYYFRYVLKKPIVERYSPALSFGAFIHDKINNTQVLAEKYLDKNELKSKLYLDLEKKKLEKRSIKPILEASKFIGWLKSVPNIQIDFECKLAIDFENKYCDFESPFAMFRGIVDLIAIVPETGVCFILDWKTGISQADSKQLEIYSLLVKKYFESSKNNIKKIISGFYYLEKSSFEMFEFKNFELIANILKKNIEEINTTNMFFPNKTYICSYCNYKETCKSEDFIEIKKIKYNVEDIFACLKY